MLNPKPPPDHLDKRKHYKCAEYALYWTNDDDDVYPFDTSFSLNDAKRLARDAWDGSLRTVVPGGNSLRIVCYLEEYELRWVPSHKDGCGNIVEGSWDFDETGHYAQAFTYDGELH